MLLGHGRAALGGPSPQDLVCIDVRVAAAAAAAAYGFIVMLLSFFS